MKLDAFQPASIMVFIFSLSLNQDMGGISVNMFSPGKKKKMISMENIGKMFYTWWVFQIYVQLQQNMTAEEPSERLAEDFRLILPELIDLATQLIQIDASLRSFLNLGIQPWKMLGKWSENEKTSGFSCKLVPEFGIATGIKHQTSQTSRMICTSDRWIGLLHEMNWWIYCEHA